MNRSDNERHVDEGPGSVWPRILLVEDDGVDAAKIVGALSGHFRNCEVVTAEQGWMVGEVALEPFDAVLLNIDLPDCSGMDVLRHIMGRGEMPVLMVTRYCDGELVSQAIRSGACDYVVKQGEYLCVLPVLVEKALVIEELKAHNRQLQGQLERRNEQLREVNEKLAKMNHQLREVADHDPLTGLSNRRRFRQMMHRRCAEARRQDHLVACMMIDLDYFKQLNDALGHQMGDEILSTLAEVLREQLRASDEPARYGGDEFVVLLPHTSASDASVLAKRISEEYVKRVEPIIPDSLRSSLSVGVHAMRGCELIDGETLVREADRALLQAKQEGKDRVVVATDLPDEADTLV